MMTIIVRCVCKFLISILFVSVGLGYETVNAATSKVEREVLDNQMVVLFSEQHQLPFITINLLFDAGSSRDPQELPGLANLTSEAILLGTEKFSLNAINRELDFLGAELSTACDRDFMTVSFRILTKHLDQGMELFNEVIIRPAFPDDQIQRKKRKIQGMLKSMQVQPDYIADRQFYRTLFRHNPYGHPVEGSIESLARMNRKSVTDFYRKFLKPNNAVLAIVGEVTREEVRSKILSRLEQWSAGESLPKADFKEIFEEKRDSVLTDKPVAQANIVMGHGGVERKNEDYYKIQVMNQIFGGSGFTSRLFREVRVQKGLAYSVGSAFISRKYSGSMQVTMQTQNSSAKEAMDIVMEVIKEMQETLPTDQEMETARQYLIGSFPMRFDSQAELASYLVQIEYYDLGLDYFKKYPGYIQAVSGNDVLQAARTYLKSGDVISSIVADLEKTDLDQ
ncbi:MAG: pitrilysin family protein [Desulforhopalus sp.]